ARRSHSYREGSLRSRLPLDDSRLIAFSRQVESSSAGWRGTKEIEERSRLTGQLAFAIVFLRRNDDDRFAVLLHYALRAFCAYTAEQLAESRLRIVKLPHF